MRKILILAVVVSLITGCGEPEMLPKHYPYVVMKEVNTLDEGVEFVAEFIEPGNAPIKRYGFYWWRGSAPMESTNPYDLCSREMESEPVMGKYSLKVTSDLIAGETYQVRPFAEDENSVVVGNIISFKAEGTIPFSVHDFSPKSGGAGDIITIKGVNFSLSKSRLRVYIGSQHVECTILSCEVNEIKAKLPENLSLTGEVPLAVRSGGIYVRADGLFSIR